jgi:hypothetical protein
MWKKYDDEFKRNALQKVFDAERGQIGIGRIRR